MIRKARPEDAERCGELIFMAGKAEFRYFFPLDDNEILKLLQVFFQKKNNIFSLDHMWVDEADGSIRGAMLLIPGSLKSTLERAIWKSVPKILTMRGLSPFLKTVCRLACSRLFPLINDDELYIDVLAVYPEFRRKKIASYLIERAVEMAFEYHLTKLSLIVNMKNQIALNVYEKNGFEKVDSIELPEKYNRYDLYGFYKMLKIIQ